LLQRTNISKLQYCSTSPYRRGGGEVVAGNVLTVFSDNKHTLSNTNRTTPYIVSTTDYDPFGMIMNGRNYNTSEYRFGFNGQEKDQEIYNNQSTTTATFWEYDGRIGRRWNVDPKPQINMSDYSCFGNNPISMIDPNGDVKDWVEKTGDDGNKSTEWDENVTSSDDKDLKPGDKYLGKLGTEIAEDGTVNILRSDGTKGKGIFTFQPVEINGGKMSEHARTISNPGAKAVYEGQAAFLNSPATKIGVTLMLAPFALSGGIISKSTEFMLYKAAISAGTQAAMNKGNIDVFDVGADALLAPGASRLFGSAIDIRPFSKDKFNWIGGHKSLGEFGLNAGTKYISGKIGSSAYNQVSPLLQNSTERAIFYNVISIPTSVFGKGLNKAINQ